MELLPGDRRRCSGWPRQGPRILARRADRLLPQPAPDQARAVDLRAARGRRGARAGGRAVRHAAGRRRGRADGRQRRRPQAVAARGAGRRAHRPHLRPRRAARRGCCASCTATPTSGGRSSRRPPVDQVRFTGSAGAGRAGRRGVRPRRSSAACSSSAARTRCSSCADANVAPRGARRRLGRVRERGPVRRRASSAPTCCREVADRFLAARRRPGRAPCAWATRADPTSTSGPLADARAAGPGARARRRGRGGRRHPALRRAGRPRRARRLAPAPAFAPAVLTGVPAGVRLAREAVPGPGPRRRGRPRRGRRDRRGQRRRARRSAPRSGRPTASGASASPASCGRAWSG